MIFTNFDERRADFIIELTAEIVQAGGVFKIHAPNEVLRDPAVLRSPTSSEQLASTRWLIALPTGRVEPLTFAELILVAYGLVLVYGQMRQASQLPAPPKAIELFSPLDLVRVLTADQVRQIVSRLKIENIHVCPVRAKGDCNEPRRNLPRVLRQVR
jgi:hypothetical protein